MDPDPSEDDQPTQSTPSAESTQATPTTGGDQPTRAMPTTREGETTRVLPATADGEPPDDDARRRRRLRWVVVGLVVLAIALAIGIYFLGKSLGYWGSSTTTMPNVVGQTTAEARDTLSNDGLKVGASDVVASSQSVGIVTATQPTPGASVTSGQSVTLFVSGGTNVNDVGIPNVVGMSESTATSTLTDHRLKAATRSATGDAPPGTVVAQDPSAGVRVAPGSVVTLTVSSGAAKVAVPSVAGDSAAQAGAALGAVGLKVGATSHQNSTAIGAGYAIGTEPPAGTAVVSGTTVNLIISAGPTTTTTAPTTTSTTTSTTTTTTTTAP